MCELEWINIASKSLAYCAQLLQQIKQLKEKFEKLQEEAARLKVLVKKTRTAGARSNRKTCGLRHRPLNWNSC